ncbi:MAG TPA: nuclear transport factor 2 family protein [Longimicrobium sp.]|jgi:ketosteroid isomerase-like protein
MSAENENLATVRRYFEALEQNADVTGFFAPDVVQEEFPNRIVPHGARRDLAALLEANARGRQVVASQRYELRGEVASGDRVAVEVLWTGVLAVDVGSLPAGATMRAHSAMFIELQGGRIVAQRNYDCFEPW